MQTINNGSVSDLLHTAATGPFMQAEIISLSGLGKLRVTCNWLYSSLNCDPNDNSPYLWQFNKVDEQHISLSPVTSCIRVPIYASVRDDINDYMQVQAPYSADWITAVGRDEIMSFTLHDLSIADFKGFNGSYLALNNFPDSHSQHSGYRLRSVGSMFDQWSQWYISVAGALQPSLQFSGQDNTASGVAKQLTSCGIEMKAGMRDRLVWTLSG
jgi:hypothetical protein